MPKSSSVLLGVPLAIACDNGFVLVVSGSHCRRTANLGPSIRGFDIPLRTGYNEEVLSHDLCLTYGSLLRIIDPALFLLMSLADLSTAKRLEDASALQSRLGASLFLLLISVYILTSSGNSVDVTDDGILRYTVTESIVERGSFALTKDVGQRWGLQGPDGRYFTNHGLGQSLLAVPFYCVGKLLHRPKFFVSLLPQVVSALVCLLLLHFCLRLGYRLKTAVALSLISGFCTQLWPESKSPFNHNIEALFSLLTVFLIHGEQEDRHWTKLFFAGLSLGFAMLTRITTALWLLPIWLLIWPATQAPTSPLKQVGAIVRNWGLFLAGFLPFGLFCLWYNHHRFGSVLESGYSLWARQHQFENFSNPLWVGLVGELISPGKGVFWYSPVLILVPFALRGFFRRQPRLACVIGLATCIYLPFFASYAAWHGDVAWGPRYLTFLMPFWVIFLGALLECRPSKRTGIHVLIIHAVVVLSAMVQLGAVMVNSNVHFFKLFESGVLHHVSTYAYPRELYFNPKYSALLDRPGEIVNGLHFTLDRIMSGNIRSADQNEMQAIDFWWTNESSRGIGPIALLVLVAPILFYIYCNIQRIWEFLRHAETKAPDPPILPTHECA